MTKPPCAGKWDLFDSTAPADHLQARTLCWRCPMLEECRANLRAATTTAYSRAWGPAGTWAGELVGRDTRHADRIVAEDAMFDTDEARRAHAAWSGGDGSDWARIGERVYQRRRGRNRRGVA